MKAKWSAILLAGLIAVTAAARLSAEGKADSAVYEDDAVRIEIAGERSEASVLEEAAFRVTVADPSGEPVSGANLEIVLSMPSMLCGQFPAVVVEQEPGVYRATAVPVMRGNWQAEAKIELNGEMVRLHSPFKVS